MAASKGWRRAAGRGSAFIGGRQRRERKGSKAGSALSIRAPVAFHRSRAIDGQRKEREHWGRKVEEEDSADDWGQRGREREKGESGGVGVAGRGAEVGCAGGLAWR